MAWEKKGELWYVFTSCCEKILEGPFNPCEATGRMGIVTDCLCEEELLSISFCPYCGTDLRTEVDDEV